MGENPRTFHLPRASAARKPWPQGALLLRRLRGAAADREARLAEREAEVEARERELAERLAEVRQRERALLVRVGKETNVRELEARRAQRIIAREQVLGPRERAVRAREQELNRLHGERERERFERERVLEQDVQRRVEAALAAGRRRLAARERELEEQGSVAPVRPLLRRAGRGSTQPKGPAGA